ncbi:MAG TPA: hypothetical protein PLV68_11505 [Ilumatobacteraceae bacterium]|nr:hypothetical protein [Ilumatobacteraceae bacterium]
MIPTLSGRIQTRIWLILFVGIPWTLIVTPFLPNLRDESGASLFDTYKATFTVLGIVLVLAVFFWELVYHFLQQFRWEKDWPVMFTLLLVIPEGIVAFYVFKWLDFNETYNFPATNGTFWWHLVSTWIVMWLFVLGPIRVLLPRWRFSGGRIFF